MCDKPSNPYCSSNMCNQLDGNCTEGCDNAYDWSHCDRLCPLYWSGNTCGQFDQNSGLTGNRWDNSFLTNTAIYLLYSFAKTNVT